MCSVVAGDASFDESALRSHLCPTCHIRRAILETLVGLRNRLSDRCCGRDEKPISETDFSNAVHSAVRALQSAGVRLEVFQAILSGGLYETPVRGLETSDHHQSQRVHEPEESQQETRSLKSPWWSLTVSLAVLLATTASGIVLIMSHGDLVGGRDGLPETAENVIDIQKLGNDGVKAIREQKWDLAISCFSEVLMIQPHNASALYNRGFSRCHLREFDGALRDIGQAVQLAPDNKRYQIALENLEKLIAQNVKAGYDE